MKLALLVAYDGTDLRGLAKQPGLDTVQGRIEDRLSRLLRHPVETVAAGRTDAGVHAEGQVFSFSTQKQTDPDWLVSRLNAFKDPTVVARAAAVVPDSFDARFSATRRSYRYRAYLSPLPDPFKDRFAWHLRTDRLDIAAMRAAAKHLIGEHDFSTFCRRSQGKTLVRRIRRISVRSIRGGVGTRGRIAHQGEDVLIEPVADSFCHQQVRALTGWLVACGLGERDPDETPEVLAAKDRHAAAPVAPPRGLTLMSVSYSPDPFAATLT